MVIQCEEMWEWCKNIMIELKTLPYKSNYYHTLYPQDGSPVIMHANTSQITVVISGTGYTEVDGTLFSLKEGSVVFVDKGKTHKFWCEEKELCLFHIHVPCETMFTDRVLIEGADFEVH